MKPAASLWAVLWIGALAPSFAWQQAAYPGRRPLYRIDVSIDYEILTFRSSLGIVIPAAADDPLGDAVFFLYANAAGIVDDARRKHIVVDGVSLDGQSLPFTLNGAVLRVQLGARQTSPFLLRIDYRGVVPRSTSPASGGSLADLLGGGGGLEGLLGAAVGGQGRAENPDFGLYSYGDGILSLGSFWYPQLAVRRQGRWIDEEPAGLGDLAYSVMSDFDVSLEVPENVKVIATGNPTAATKNLESSRILHRFSARDVRDFALLISEDYVRKTAVVRLDGREVTIEACVGREHEDQLDRTLDIASRAMEIFTRRFGPYPYTRFKVVEGPLRGGAGGMEFSGVTAIASMLYRDWNKELGSLFGALGLGNLETVLKDLNPGARTAAPGAKGGSKEPDNPMGAIFENFLGRQMGLLDSVLEMTIAHEAAHQWWAIGVGSDSVGAPFVDEGLANYSAVLYFEDRYGAEAARKISDMHLKTPYVVGRMLGVPDAPANLATSGYGSSLQYAAVVYGKGGLYYDALRRAVGDGAFFDSLGNYYRAYRGRLAGPTSLLDIIRAEAPGVDVDRIYRRWILEPHGDEDISGGEVVGIGDLMRQLLSGLGGAPSNKKP